MPPLPPPLRDVRWLHYASLDYGRAWALQRAVLSRRLAASRIDGAAAAPPLRALVVSTQHGSVYTLGRSAAPGELRFAASLAGAPPVWRVERGGHTSWHGPGQLVVYPLLDLRAWVRDLHWYVAAVEGTVADALRAAAGLRAGSERGFPGVWVGGRKIAQLGMNVNSWATSHGFAVNVAPDMRHFAGIIPCGIADREVTSVLREMMRGGGEGGGDGGGGGGGRDDAAASTPTMPQCAACGNAVAIERDGVEQAPPGAIAAAANCGAVLAAVQNAFAHHFTAAVDRRCFCAACRGGDGAGAETRRATAGGDGILDQTALAGIDIDDLLRDIDAD